MTDRFQKMIDHVQENPDFLKIYIFHEVGKTMACQPRKTMLESFNEMCKLYGDDKMDYSEFAFWYINFYSGEYDLNNDTRSSENSLPSALQCYIFSDVMMRVPIWKLFKNYCKIEGNETTDHQEFEFWYMRMNSGNFDISYKRRPSENCPPSVLQRYIFLDVKMDVPIWESFKNYCKIEGNEMTVYPDYEFWYMKFARGEFNMDHNRSADPKHRSLNELPVHIFEKVFEDFKFSERMVIRKVSRSLQSMIDSWKPNIEHVNFSNVFSKTSLHFDKYETSHNNFLSYNDTPENGKCIAVTKNLRFFIENGEHWRLGFYDLRAVLGNPMLKLDSLVIRYIDPKHTEHFLKMLNSLNGAQIHVENLKLFFFSADCRFLPIIQQLKSEVLKEIELSIQFYEADAARLAEICSQLASSEHLKNVKMFTFDGYVVSHSFDCFLQLPRVTIEVDLNKSITQQTTKIIKHLVKSTVLEVFYIKSRYDVDVNAIMKQLGIKRFPRVQNRNNVVLCKIPDSDQFYEIEVTEKMIRIERKP